MSAFRAGNSLIAAGPQASDNNNEHSMFYTICTLISMFAMLAFLGFATMAINRNRKGRSLLRRIKRRIAE